MSFGIPVRNGLGLGLTPSTMLSSGQPGGRPALFLNFVGTTALDSRVTFTRASTATFVGSNGLIQSAAIDAPRFDFDPVTLAPLGLLIEEQRTNLLLRSQEFNNAAWPRVRSSFTADAAVAPDGTTSADKLVIDTTPATNHSTSQTVSVVSGTSYTFTVYAKAAEFSQINLRFPTQFPAGNCFYDLIAGVTTPSGSIGSASMTDVGNGWWRCALTGTANATAASSGQIFLAQGGSITIATADDVSGAYLWGAQVEAAAFATSYIPTDAAQVTRAADIASITGANFSSWYNQSEGTIVASILSAPVNNIAQQALYLSDGTASNVIFTRRTSGASVATAVTTGGVVQADVSSGSMIAGSALYTYAFAYALNDLAESVNGAAVGTDASATIPSLSQINLGSNVTGTQYVNGHIRSIRYYPVRLSDAQLQALTS